MQTVSIVPRKALKITQQFQNSAMKKEGIFVTNTSYGDMVIVIKSNTRFNLTLPLSWKLLASLRRSSGCALLCNFHAKPYTGTAMQVKRMLDGHIADVFLQISRYYDKIMILS